MDCLVAPVSTLIRRCSSKYSSSRLGYRALSNGVELENDGMVRVVVGKEKKEFLVDSFVLEESPFRVLIEMGMKDKESRLGLEIDDAYWKVIYVDIDAILFEHMLWLMYHDFSSLFKLNMMDIIDFYAQDY